MPDAARFAQQVLASASASHTHTHTHTHTGMAGWLAAATRKVILRPEAPAHLVGVWRGPRAGGGHRHPTAQPGGLAAEPAAQSSLQLRCAHLRTGPWFSGTAGMRSMHLRTDLAFCSGTAGRVKCAHVMTGPELKGQQA
eukprot:1159972-Pelagomonas_calceolata.AAC.15